MKMRRRLARFLCGVLALVPLLGASSAMASCGDDGEKSTTITAPDTSPEYNTVDLSGYHTYYFDGASGNDANAGTSESSPKKSIASAVALAKTATEQNPVRLLFKKGTTFEGKGTFEGYSATKEKPLVLDSYGSGDGYPKFIGTGVETTVDKPDAVLWFTRGNLRVSNLEITGPTAYQGIIVQPKEGGVQENIVIEGNYVHDINFQWTYATEPKDTDPETIDVEKVCPMVRVGTDSDYGRYRYRKYSAIILDNDYPSAPSWFENCWIKNNRVENVGKIGINVYNRWDNQFGCGYGYNKFTGDSTKDNNPARKLGRYPHKNMFVTGNTVICAGGDAIVLGGSQNSVLEKNVSYYAAYLTRGGFWNAGVWVHSCEDVYYQYNEVAYTYLTNGGEDGEGLDIDNACRNIVCRYNYVHHNQGGGLLLCNVQTEMTIYDPRTGGKKEKKTDWGVWGNNVAYGNVFAYNGNDWNAARSAFITTARKVDGFTAYNNTVICRTDVNNQRIISMEDHVALKNHSYYNNIFYGETDKGAFFPITKMLNSSFKDNLFYHVKSESIEENGDHVSNRGAVLNTDPNFSIPADINGYSKLISFTPRNGGLFRRGTAVLEKDILGNDVKGVKFLGAIGKGLE